MTVQINQSKVSNVVKAVNVQLIQSKGFIYRGRKVFTPVQVKMTIVSGHKKQDVTFGYSRLGGRKTYAIVNGKLRSMTRGEFIQILNKGNISNRGQIINALKRITYLNSQHHLVATCECCGKPKVTTANMDFIQRRYHLLADVKGNRLHEFSKVCTDCQKTYSEENEKQPTQETIEPIQQPIQEDIDTSYHCILCSKHLPKGDILCDDCQERTLEYSYIK